MGGRFVQTKGYKDQGQTPNFQLAVMDFGGPLLVYEILGLVGLKGPGGKSYPGRLDNEFYLEEGLIKGDKFYPKGKTEGVDLPDVKLDQATGPGLFIFQNFIDCVRSRKRENLIAEIEVAHYSSALCHLANASYRLGQPTQFGKGYELLGDCAQVKQSVKAIEENLQVAIGMDLSKQTYQLGPKLAFDAGTEKFLGNDQANQLLTRKYREPFVVPEKV